MITAVDTNVVLDVLTDDPALGPASERAMRQALGDGALMACDVVWAEIGAWYVSPDAAAHAMDQMGIAFASLDPEVAAAAGTVWQRYRREYGGRDRLLPDFLIGTHAWMRADRFLTRDRGFYGKFFSRLRVIDPSKL